MKNARVLIAEGRLGWPPVFQDQLEDEGHMVVANVDSLESVRDEVDGIDGLDVAMVDNYIRRGRDDSSDGQEACRVLRRKFESLVIIDTSDEGSLKYVGLADYHEPRLDDTRRVHLTGYLDVIDSL